MTTTSYIPIPHILHQPGTGKRMSSTFFKAVLQPKLSINPSNDKYEQEADAVADKIMHEQAGSQREKVNVSPLIPVQKTGYEAKENNVQREATQDEKNAPGKDLAGYVSGTGHRGEPLSKEERNFFEPRFGYDFGNVKIHTDSIAAKSAEGINALAYTSGSTIVFNKGQYSPSSEAGKRLLAHELTHVVQQGGHTKHVQRAPLKPDPGTGEIHQELLEDFSKDTGTPLEDASRFSPEYSRWLTVKSGSNAKFSPPTIVKENPLTRRKNSLSEGLTELSINGQLIAGNDIGSLVANMVQSIKPVAVESNQLPGNKWNCQFDQNFKIDTSAKITIATAPSQNGWLENMAPAQVLLPADLQRLGCAGQASVPVTLRGAPNNQQYAQLIHNSELEHVKELETLHKRHLVPYYKFIMNLKGFGSSAADCVADLNNKINKQDEQAATAFALADIAETRKYDDPASTHHSTLIPTVAPNCASITLTGNLNNQQPNLAPGNVRKIPPVVTNINPANLAVSGSTLNDGTTVVQQFSSQQIAKSAMDILQHYQVTSINRIGPFTYLLSNGAAPAGPLKGVNELEINPDLYQVTPGMPNINTWVISQIKGDAYFSIIDFGAARDEAYSAADVMRASRFTKQCWVGPAANPPFSFFRID